MIENRTDTTITTLLEGDMLLAALRNRRGVSKVSSEEPQRS